MAGGSRSLGSLTLDLIARIGGFSSGMDQAARIADNRARKIDRTFRNLRNSIRGALAFIGGAALVRSIVQATSEAEKALSLLDNAVRASGGSSGRTTEQLAGMATELQKVTTYSDEAVMGAEQLLLRFQSIQGLNFDNALQASLDLSTALGTDLNSAALLVGKALESPVKGMNQLARSGVVLADDQKALIKRLSETGRQAEAQSLLIEELQKRYGGAAAAARDNFGGALQGLQNAIGDLLEIKGGLPELTEQVNLLTEQLQDPNTVDGINNVTAALARLLGIGVEGISELGSFGELLGRFAAKATGNLGQIDEIEGDIRDLDRAINNSFMGKPLKYLFTNTEELKNMREELVAQLKVLGVTPSSPAAAATPGGKTPAAPPSEEFEKLAADLERQIALYGKSGEAAKISYDIQSGALDDLSTAEQKRVLQLARQLDAIVATADADKEAAAASKKSAEERAADQERLQQAFESQEDALLRQMVITSEATELDQLRYELNSGSLQKLTDGQKEWLKLLAADVDALHKRTEAEKEYQELLDEGKSLTESLRTPLEVYQDAIRELNRLVDAGAISWETYGRGVAVAADQLDDATDSFHFMEEAASGTKDILADGLFGAMQGEIDNIGKSFLKMIDQLVAKALAADLTDKLFGKEGKGGGWLDKGLGFLSGFFGGGKAGGGAVSSGTMYRVNETGVESLRIPGRSDYLMTGSFAGEVIPSNRTGGGRSGNTTQNIVVQGMPTQRTARQMALEESRRQRIATARLA